MTREFPACPICKSHADYQVSPSRIIVRCNACGAKFRSDDLRDPEGGLRSLSLFSPPSALVERDVVAALSTLRYRVLPASFWETLKPEAAWIRQSEAATRTVERKPDKLQENPKPSKAAGVIMFLLFFILPLFFFGTHFVRSATVNRIETTGVVTSVSRAWDGDATHIEWKCQVRFVYQRTGENVFVSVQFHSETRVGYRFTIRYDPDNPRDFRYGDSTTGDTYLLGFGLFLYAIAALFIGLPVISIIGARLEKRNSKTSQQPKAARQEQREESARATVIRE